ncbi:MAG: thioredoxin family protein [Planctomycetia bacterium]|nr:thioredoxin family protein [Planctomycetia bacterium]
MKRSLPFAAAALALVCLGASPPAQDEGDRRADDPRDKNRLALVGVVEDFSIENFGEDHVQVEAWITPPVGVEPPYLVIEATIETGWHITSITQGRGASKASRITVNPNPALTAKLETKSFRAATPPVIHERPEFNDGDPTVEEHEGTAVWFAPLTHVDGLELEKLRIEGSLFTQVCQKVCVDENSPFTAVLDPLKIAPGEGAIPSGGDPNKQGLWGLIGLSVLGAMISWVMPCVYPMIPITISFFGKVAERKHAGKTAVAASYGLGIAGTFVVIGLAIGLLSFAATSDAARADLSATGNSIATNPWLNLGIGILFILFALSMFGLFTIQVPSWLLIRTDRAGRGAKSAHFGGVLLGITFALASFTCTVPVVGYLLVEAASGTGEGLLRCTVGMVVYGVVFAAPFIALSMFPAALSRMPRAGAWMDTVKTALAFLELGVALKFLWVPDLQWGIGILSRPIVLALFLVLGVATAGYFLGLLPIGHGERPRPLRVGLGRWAAAALTLVLMAPVGMSLWNWPSYQARGIPWVAAVALETLLPPGPNADEIARAEGWFIDDYEGALAEARRLDKPLFVDFTGVNCSNCRVMEQKVFPDPEVRALFDKMVRAKLYVDRDDEKSLEQARLQSTRYALSSQPFYVILDPRDDRRPLATDTFNVTTFEGFLATALQKFEASRKVASR